MRGGLRRHAVPLAAAALVAFGLAAVVSEWAGIRDAVGQAHWRPLALALAFTALSYACLAYSFAAISRLFGVRMGRKELFEIGFVSYALSHLLSSGGAAGYSLRVLVARRRGLPVADVLAASFLHSAFNNLALFLLLPVGLAYALTRRSLSSSTLVEVGAAAFVLLVLVVAVGATLVSGRVRSAALRSAGALWHRLFRRDIGPRLSELDATMGRAVASARGRPGRLILPALCVGADWSASAAALWACFLALGRPLGVGVLIAGFAIGVVAGLVSMVPGGIGVQDGSMAAVYALLGVPLGVAVLAAVLFRLVYYVVPFLVSLAFYRRLLGEDAREYPGAQGEARP